MFTKIRLIANVKRGSHSEHYTYYFFSHKYRILLPVLSDKRPGSKRIYQCFNRILGIFDINIKRVLIYRYDDGYGYYSYLTVENAEHSYEMDLELNVLIDIHRTLGCPIYIRTEILRSKGISITKRMVLNALREDLYLK